MLVVGEETYTEPSNSETVMAYIQQLPISISGLFYKLFQSFPNIIHTHIGITDHLKGPGQVQIPVYPLPLTCHVPRVHEPTRQAATMHWKNI